MFRCMVHALSPGGPYELGFEDGMGSARWKASQPEAASSTVRSSDMLIKRLTPTRSSSFMNFGTG